MEPFEAVFDCVIHLFDFIQNKTVRTVVQIAAMILTTAALLALLYGLTKAALWIIGLG
jgi:hypothetical protein